MSASEYACYNNENASIKVMNTDSQHARSRFDSNMNEMGVIASGFDHKQ